ncbi:DsbA family protein [Paenibacillus sp. LS1]|uniref:DsbA family protein n=1 Tax=Paenibacillus sp. LS1 TaxID=2992120 RepID=UPI00223140A3|nr:DsbA family protein [Paenibacillus sp. LS1]MCW3793987.1 DsbA family protein [Paenibacillus sp. LS1]
MKFKRLFILCAAVIVVCAMAILLAFMNKEDSLDTLPNYTLDKEKIVVDGFNYENQPVLGSPQAKVKVIEFADFKCPACRNWSSDHFQTLKRDYIDTGKVQFYFANYAFLDRDSYLAGIAGEAIYQQSNEKFWEFYELLYQNQGDPTTIWATPKFLVDLVKQNMEGIDMELFQKNLKNFDYLHQVKEDYKIGGYYGVNGTPTFFINDQIVRISSYEDLFRQIDTVIE